MDISKHEKKSGPNRRKKEPILEVYRKKLAPEYIENMRLASRKKLSNAKAGEEGLQLERPETRRMQHREVLHGHFRTQFGQLRLLVVFLDCILCLVVYCKDD